MEKCPPLHLNVVVIEKEAFESLLTKVVNFTYLLLFIIDYVGLLDITVNMKVSLRHCIVWTIF